MTGGKWLRLSSEVKVHRSVDGRGVERIGEVIGPDALGVVLCDEVAQLLDDGVDEFLSVSVRLPELGEDVVLPARLLHPGGGGEKKTGSEEGENSKFSDFTFSVFECCK